MLEKHLYDCVRTDGASVGELITQEKEKKNLDEQECLFSFYFSHVNPCLVLTSQ